MWIIHIHVYLLYSCKLDRQEINLVSWFSFLILNQTSEKKKQIEVLLWRDFRL